MLHFYIFFKLKLFEQKQLVTYITQFIHHTNISILKKISRGQRELTQVT